jgi:simple sugar transport system ATP-binding protein
MTGHEVVLPHNDAPACTLGPMLQLRNLKVRSDRGFLALDDLSLYVCKGEIVGLAGVSGNGQRELAEVINGLRKVESGQILFDGKDIANFSPAEVIKAGMGYVPEERNTEGIVPSFSMKENFILKDNQSETYSSHSFIKNKVVEEMANQLREQFDIRSPNIDVAAGSLSGGNIQKVILAREISRNPKFLVAVYPTRGLDMGAAEFIHKQLLKLRNEGVGILLISEELEEITNLSDQVAVIFKGKIQKVLPSSEASRRRLGILMAGVKDDEEI